MNEKEYWLIFTKLELCTLFLIQKPVETLDEALDNIKDGAYWAIIDIPANFSTYLIKR